MTTEVVSHTKLLHCLDPVVSDQTHTLILGSFPSRASLEAMQYYAHPRNHFWPLMASMFEPVDNKASYEERVDALLSCGIGIWDVFASCMRSGSMDVDIKNMTFNDFSRLRQMMPGLKKIAFNGRVAAKAVNLISELGYRTYVLPSTSPAYTLPMVSKLGIWREVLAPVYSLSKESLENTPYRRV